MTASAEQSNIWTSVLNRVETKLDDQIFNSWFRPIQFDGFDENGQILHLKTKQVNKDWIHRYYSELLTQTLAELNCAHFRVNWNIEDSELKDDILELAEIEPISADKQNFNLRSIPANIPQENTLNPKYKFENFVVGSCNEFAHAAGLAVVESPGNAYNPMFIYGGVGLGKTHLMHAIGHSVRERNSHMRVAYISSEKFMNELINAIRYDKTQAFRDKYRLIDVLLMDDVQFMAGKERTQEEFFHTFNALYNDQKQIIITSDRPPREIPTLEERLHSRFEWGLIVDIEPPDLETKVAILKRKADMEGIELPDDVAMFIAGKVKHNIRELEGSLVRLVAMSSLRGIPITKMLAQDAVRNIVDSDRPEGLTIERISKAVAEHYKLTFEDLKSKNNAKQIAFPRQISMYLCKRLTKHSFPEIGRAFGGKHHTTVMHSVEKISGLVKEDKVFHKVVSDLIDSLCS